MASANAARKTKMDKEREKQMQDRLQVLITAMLKDEDNKYCVDCDSKGPRWSSWNLGLFLCIRCAGIHRNLGVHISKVKSVNLDSWTPVQVASMQLMGNSRARAVYEANLPDGFLRPQNNQSLEQFIRAKYEKNKYIAKEYVAQKPQEFPEGWYELIEAEKQKKDIRKLVLPSHNGSNATPAYLKASGNSPICPASSSQTASTKSPNKKETVATPAPKLKSSDDLFGLGLGAGDADLLGMSRGGVQQPRGVVPVSTADSSGDFAAFVSASSSAASSSTTAASQTTEENDFFSQSSATVAQDKAKNTKDSIMALFAQKPEIKPQPQPNGFGQVQQQMFLNSFQAGQPQPGAGAGGFSGAFGVNPQSNPFLNSPSPNAAGSGMSLFGGAATPQTGNGGVSQVQNQFGGLTLGNSFGSAGPGMGNFTSAPATNGQFQQAPPTSGNADILSLF